MKFFRFVLVILIFFTFSLLKADEIKLENKITKNLRCLICQGQSIYDSDSEFAISLKLVVKNKINEGYSEDPELVAALGEAMILGIQGEGDNFLGPNHMLSTAKHFIADGGTSNGVDQGDAVISELGLRNLHGEPYFKALDACVQTIMASFNSWNGEKLHGNKYLLTDVLKQQMNFEGFVVGDWNGHGQVKGCSNTSCSQSFNAGVDIFMVPDEWQELYKTTLKQVKNGSISIERLNDAVRRILRVKMQIGLLDGKKPHEYKSNFIGHPDHIAIARRAVRESLVLLKNNENLLPLNPNKHYLVVGNAALSINSQMGGWTITWQARDNKNPISDSIASGFNNIIPWSG